MSLTGLLIAIICICGATLITAHKVLKNKPAELMRPKSPVSGKKILLELLPFWHNINFSNKVTIRNIFRYKKRVLVTIIGICGCTALMLCGFGIKDSIVDITNKQYQETFIYNETIYTEDLNQEEITTIFSNEIIIDKIPAYQKTATIDESTLTMIALDSKDFSKIFNTIDASTNKETTFTKDSIMITDKLAELQDIDIGDTITILDGDANEYTFTITDIVKNYIGHYIYIDKSIIKDYKTNTVFLKTNISSLKDQEILTKELLENEKVLNVIHTETLMESTSDMIKSLDLIIAVLVVLAAALSFVVLYNLSNINIIERKREIATLKVLGFYDKEVDNYITRENLILTILGIIPGFVLGYFLTFITIGTVEMENTRFLRVVSPMSYIYAAIISLVFTFIVNFVTHFTLKKIDMIESLKSVE
jgi:putative ABC transport system permease protein